MTRTRTIWLPYCAQAGSFSLACTSLIALLTAVYLIVGMATFALYLSTGDAAWVDRFFRVPAAFLFVTLAAMQLGFSLMVRSSFRPSEPMRAVWTFISLSAVCEVAGALSVQIFAADSPLNLLRSASFWSESLAGAIRSAGLVMGGSCRFALLTAGLYFALRVYRRAGFLGALRWPDRLLLAAVAIYIVWEAWDLLLALDGGKHPRWSEVAGWPVDPFLWLLLLEALLLYRSVQLMGFGWVGRCWLAFAAGILLVSIGDVSIWAAAYGYLPWPWSALEWYIWLPASAAFALAPAYQLEAIEAALAGKSAPPVRGPS